MNCHCGGGLSSMWLEEPGVASAFCASGHRLYFFKREDTGAWETAEERRARMAVTLFCGGCGNEFRVAARPYTERNARVYCDACQEKNMKACKKRQNAEYLAELSGRNRENSRGSSWRFFGKN